jgi:MFS family permease
MQNQRYVLIYVTWFLLMMMLGSVYTYSIYRPVIEDQFNLSATLSGIPYMLSLASYAVSMYLTGKGLRVISIKRFIHVGGFLFVLAWLGTSLSQTLIMFTLFYGLIMGVSVGILYGCALQFVQRYGKQHVGFFIGIMLLAFGLSSVILSPVASWVIGTYSITTLFTGYTLASASIVFPLYFLYPNDSPLNASNNQTNGPFIRLLLIFTFATMIGLTMIGLTNVIGLFEYGYSPLNVALAISGFALLNAVSRPLFGWGLDRFGFTKMAILSIGLMGLASIIGVFNQGHSWLLFLLSYGLYWFNLGAWLSLMPNYIKQKHGKEQYAALYGKVFLGYGISAIIGTLASSIVMDLFGNSTSIYILILSILLILGFLIQKESQAQNLTL